ncbi:hypothetical protein [Glycomyces sp. NRRL B-16210]|uniref:hypothetical protein n=1 Tax=Glycomyces sp. NRRL B-16210 TaxID=1463821 RepID=UPI0004BFB92C|nr:hypothetical protein [Glycomyces sp. NRRL B-16210]
MANLLELAAQIEADRARFAALAGPINSAKGQAEIVAGAIERLGLVRSAGHARRAVGQVEEAQSILAALDGTLVKAHWAVMSAVHGRIGPGAKGSGAIVPLTQFDERTGAPKAGLDAVPPHLREAPKPTGDDLLEPPRRRKGKALFQEAVGKADQVEDATKTFGQQFDSAWEAFFGEPSPAKAQQNAVSETQSSRGPVSTEMPAPKVSGGGAVMATFVASVVVAKAIQPIVRQFERKHLRDKED